MSPGLAAQPQGSDKIWSKRPRWFAKREAPTGWPIDFLRAPGPEFGCLHLPAPGFVEFNLSGNGTALNDHRGAVRRRAVVVSARAEFANNQASR